MKTMRFLTELYNTPWLLQREFFQSLLKTATSQDLQQMQAMFTPTPSEVHGDDGQKSISVLNISGPITKGSGGFMAFLFGGTSTDRLTQKFNEVLDDDGVQAIVLKINSPGGEVTGTQEFAKTVHQARGIKPIISFVDGMMASAATWIGTAADEVIISGDNNLTGSIGVVSTHIDTSKMEENIGVKVTEIISGKFKNVGSQHKPLSSDDRSMIQDRADQIYTNFIKDVAEFRGKTTGFVQDRMADGRIFVGQDAIERGLVDKIQSFPEMLSGFVSQPSKEGFSMKEKEGVVYTAEEFKAEFERGVAEGKAQGIQEGMTQGAEAERARIQGIEEQSMEGHEELIAKLKFDGKTTGAEAAVQVLKAEKAAKAQRVENIHRDTPADLPNGNPPSDPPKDPEAKREALIEAKMKELSCSYEDAAMAVSKEHRDLFNS